jgi:Holliday junction resolvase RusA-like endonuclease
VEPIRIEVAGEAAPFRKKVASWNAKDGRFGTHAYDEKKYAGWKDHARLAASRAMNGRPPLVCAIDFKVKIFFEVPESWSGRKKRAALVGIVRPCVTPDFDNLAKACADALTGIVFRDDKFIVDAHIQKFYSDRPRVEMEVREVDFVIPQSELALSG